MYEASTTPALQHQTMISRLLNLHSLYFYLTNAYCLEPLINRRYLYGSHLQAAPEIRAFAQAKFVLAATLQWLPSAWNYSQGSMAVAMGRIQRKGETDRENVDELCPIWLCFFSEMVDLDRLLVSGQKIETRMATETLLIAAEEKYTWLDAQFQVVRESGGWEAMPNGVELSDSMIFTGWNMFCFRVATGESLQQALTTIRPTGRVEWLVGPGGLPAGTNCQREYFAFKSPVGEKPWTVFTELVDKIENSSGNQTGGELWRCGLEEPELKRYETLSYAAAYCSVEEAFEVNQLFDGRNTEHKEASCTLAGRAVARY